MENNNLNKVKESDSLYNQNPQAILNQKHSQANLGKRNLFYGLIIIIVILLGLTIYLYISLNSVKSKLKLAKSVNQDLQSLQDIKYSKPTSTNSKSASKSANNSLKESGLDISPSSLIQYLEPKTKISFSYPKILGTPLVDSIANNYSDPKGEYLIFNKNSNNPAIKLSIILSSDKNVGGIGRGGILTGVKSKEVERETIMIDDTKSFTVTTYQAIDDRKEVASIKNKYFIEGSYFYKPNSDQFEMVYIRNVSHGLDPDQLKITKNIMFTIGKSIKLPF